MNIKNFKLVAILIITTIISVSCSDDDPITVAKVMVNGKALVSNGDDFTGDIDGDFNGDGGGTSKTFTWSNALSTADYNADITTAVEGTFNMVVKDADAAVVLDKTLSGAVEPDSFSGVTSNGSSGIWSVTITLTSFNGDGSFSLSEGN